jgi:hypothetical protein
LPFFHNNVKRLKLPTDPPKPPSEPPESGRPQIIGKRKIHELVEQIEPGERLEPEVEDVRIQRFFFISLIK